ncbi:hypothetical protein NQ314_004985 [Rhamnusium bicolor]|uniref:Uncharacterized protein n=1 Tax=Rhamnusium bicolor TaxID=1586634 RepID=A0AAV8ZI67_9CUCU|nr:hypothetical protein NQ314_004985 [Rhamnusium bicolor]
MLDESAEAQRHNESTPTKDSTLESSRFKTPKSKVKARLDFSECSVEKFPYLKKYPNYELLMC